jgi:c-di-GMP-binding flagellar brake protein YcgR
MEVTVNFKRRRYPRFDIDLPVQYNRMEESYNRYGRAMNVSEDGLLIYSREQMDIDQHLKSKIFFLLGTEFNSIEMETQIVWTGFSSNEVWGTYRSGLRLVDISEKDRSKLKNLLLNLSQ